MDLNIPSELLALPVLQIYGENEFADPKFCFFDIFSYILYRSFCRAPIELLQGICWLEAKKIEKHVSHYSDRNIF